MIVERYVIKKDWYHKIPSLVKWGGTFLIVNIGWITFQVPTMKDFVTYLKYLFGQGEEAQLYTLAYYFNSRIVFLLLVTIVGTVCFSKEKVQKQLQRWSIESVAFNILKYIILVCLLFLCFITIISVSYTPFLYFQF